MTKEEMMEQLTTTVSHPEFENLINEIEAQPEDRRLEWTRENATVEKMKEKGIPILDGFRVCVRLFEDSDKPTEKYDTIQITTPKVVGTWTVCASLGFYLCVSVGYSFNQAVA